MRRAVAFLFLGETLLIPHLYPIVEALARRAPGMPIDLWVSTSVHERLLGGWVAAFGDSSIRVRRAPGFRAVPDDGAGRNPELPAKLPMLARLAPALARTAVVVCAEQTSLWLPTVLPLRTRFIKTPHGAGTLMARNDRRRRAPWLTLVAAERERWALSAVGVDSARIRVTGYVKAAFDQRVGLAGRFAERRPIVLYNPHWQQDRSSWWRWGVETIERIVASGRFNLIFAPHQRLIERAPEVRGVALRYAGHDAVHCDLGSFAGVDGSYTAAADIYLGDTSSQVVEFLMTPRPCVFLNAHAADWSGDPTYDMWQTGPVLDTVDALVANLVQAPADHPRYADIQRELAEAQLGPRDRAAPDRAAAAILDALDEPR